MNNRPKLYDQVMELDFGIIDSASTEEAVQHILAYFQQEFSRPYPPPTPLSHEEKILLEQIDSAFDRVVLEDGIGLMTMKMGLDSREICEALAPYEERTDWRRITPSMVSAYGSILHLYNIDPKGYRFFLPALLTLGLRGQLKFFEDPIFYLPLAPESCGIYESKAILLNDPQLEAVMNYIEYYQKMDTCPFFMHCTFPEDGHSQ